MCTGSLNPVLALPAPDMIDECAMDDELDAYETAEHMPPSPNTWSDGSIIKEPVSKIETAGAGVFL